MAYLHCLPCLPIAIKQKTLSKGGSNGKHIHPIQHTLLKRGGEGRPSWFVRQDASHRQQKQHLQQEDELALEIGPLRTLRLLLHPVLPVPGSLLQYKTVREQVLKVFFKNINKAWESFSKYSAGGTSTSMSMEADPDPRLPDITFCPGYKKSFVGELKHLAEKTS